jgi:hypothetical protein
VKILRGLCWSPPAVLGMLSQIAQVVATF